MDYHARRPQELFPRSPSLLALPLSVINSFGILEYIYYMDIYFIQEGGWGSGWGYLSRRASWTSAMKDALEVWAVGEAVCPAGKTKKKRVTTGSSCGHTQMSPFFLMSGMFATVMCVSVVVCCCFILIFYLLYFIFCNFVLLFVLFSIFVFLFDGWPSHTFTKSNTEKIRRTQKARLGCGGGGGGGASHTCVVAPLTIPKRHRCIR